MWQIEKKKVCRNVANRASANRPELRCHGANGISFDEMDQTLAHGIVRGFTAIARISQATSVIQQADRRHVT
jgi:hypothetical protein